MPAHKHAHLMMEYAKDALETNKPWERWEVSRPENGVWIPLGSSPGWGEGFAYRRKPRTININGHEAPEPVREPLKEGQGYYFPALYKSEMCISTYWRCDDSDYRMLKRGLIHLTKEAAIAHAKALLSFTELTNDKESQ